MNFEDIKLLVVEDEPDILNVLERTLQKEGYQVDSALSGDLGLSKALSNHYDAIILDVMLPNISGFDVLKRIREEKHTPVIMLTAKDDTDDKVTGLDLGADDYLTKPFDIKELKARLRVMLRKQLENKATRITLGDTVIDTIKHQVTKDNTVVALTSREYFLLEHLALNQGKIVSRDALHELISDDNDETQSNILDVHISNIRKKLSRELIVTHRGAGYCIP